MRTQISLQELFKGKNLFTGNCWETVVNGNVYPVVKGFLGVSPLFLRNPLYNVRVTQPACYILKDSISGKVYVGSSGSVYERIVKHKWYIARKQHENTNFNEVLKTSEMKDFLLFLFFTQNREEAFELEQFFVNHYKAAGELINIAHDVRYAMLGTTLSEEHRRKISKANSGRLVSEEARKNISLSRKTSLSSMAQLARIHDRKKRAVSINGVVYDGISEAVRATGLSDGFIRQKAEKSDSNIFFVSDPVSPLNGRTLSLAQRQKLSDSRKSQKAIDQFRAATEKTMVKIVLNGTLYPSVREAVRQTKISEATINRQFRKIGRKKIDGCYVLNYTPPKSPLESQR